MPLTPSSLALFVSTCVCVRRKPGEYTAGHERRNKYIVKSCATQGDILDALLLEDIQDLCTGVIIHKDADGFMTRCEHCGLLVESNFVEGEFEITGVTVHGVEGLDIVLESGYNPHRSESTGLSAIR
jgi:hypothetical protein